MMRHQARGSGVSSCREANRRPIARISPDSFGGKASHIIIIKLSTSREVENVFGQICSVVRPHANAIRPVAGW